MARSLRLEYAGAFYHIVARGDRGARIFLDDEDRRFFLESLGEACGRTGWRVHAWVLLANHYHLFIETPEPNLVDVMKWLQNTYTRRFNLRHGKGGRTVFGDRYKSVVVEGKRPEYYGALVNYIHLNPVRAKLVQPRAGQSILDYPWSSLASGYALAPGKREPWLAAETGLSILGHPDTAAGRRRMALDLDRRAAAEGLESGKVPLPEERDGRLSHLRRGWYWGSEEFGAGLAKRLSAARGKGGSRRSSPGPAEHGLARAEVLVKEGLKAAGLKEKDLARQTRGDMRALEIARLVREQTAISNQWIATRLGLKSRTNVSQRLRTTPRNDAMLPRELQKFLEKARKA